jgi:hypothetical protein
LPSLPALSAALPKVPSLRRPAPRYWIQILAAGGVDAIVTLDPKTPSDVERWVDLPYGANAIHEAAGIPLGPHFEGLRPVARELTILKGVAVSTANHPTGTTQYLRLRRGTDASAPTFLDLVGLHRDTQALGTVTLGRQLSIDYSSTWLGSGGGRLATPFFTRLETLDPDGQQLAAEILRNQAKDLARQGSLDPRAARASKNLGDAARFVDRFGATQRWKREDWGLPAEAAEEVEAFQRALWLFEHDLCRCVFLRMSYGTWDTHTRNADTQGYLNPLLAELFRRFLVSLQTRTNAHGPLIDQTAIILGSEIGRFPALNSDLGKDHFPEIPLLFAGAGFGDRSRGRVFGATGKQMESLPVSMTSGRPSSRGLRPTLDDVGATLLRIAGLDPQLYGYRGRTLDFLGAT